MYEINFYSYDNGEDRICSFKGRIVPNVGTTVMFPFSDEVYLVEKVQHVLFVPGHPDYADEEREATLMTVDIRVELTDQNFHDPT